MAIHKDPPDKPSESQVRGGQAQVNHGGRVLGGGVCVTILRWSVLTLSHGFCLIEVLGEGSRGEKTLAGGGASK